VTLIYYAIGYSFDEHVGKIPGLKDAVANRYEFISACSAHLSDDLLELVRRERGVKQVTQNFYGVWHEVDDNAVPNTRLAQDLGPTGMLNGGR
jgi:hypothetical protein